MNGHLPALDERAPIKCRQGGVLLAVQKGAGYNKPGSQKLREAMHKGVFQCVCVVARRLLCADAYRDFFHCRAKAQWAAKRRPCLLRWRAAGCRLGWSAPRGAAAYRGQRKGRGGSHQLPFALVGRAKCSMLATMYVQPLLLGCRRQVKATHDDQQQHSQWRTHLRCRSSISGRLFMLRMRRRSRIRSSTSGLRGGVRKSSGDTKSASMLWPVLCSALHPQQRLQQSTCTHGATRSNRTPTGLRQCVSRPPEVADEALHGPGSGIAQRADRVALDDLSGCG